MNKFWFFIFQVAQTKMYRNKLITLHKTMGDLSERTARIKVSEVVEMWFDQTGYKFSDFPTEAGFKAPATKAAGSVAQRTSQKPRTWAWEAAHCQTRQKKLMMLNI